MKKRSDGILQIKRKPNPWPEDKEFRILSIDGGGIKGIFPACFLEQLESSYLSEGESLTDYFDLICGTSTGGIIALGLGAGLKASELSKLYIEKGNDIFPSKQRCFNKIKRWFFAPYDRNKLENILTEVFGEKKFGESKIRLCIPSFEGKHSEVFVFKTAHHLDFKHDHKELMTTVALSTSAAPSFFRPFKDGGYIFVDGGVWANNPCMIGLVEALTTFDVSRDKVKILSIGCGDEPYKVNKKMLVKGGMCHWAKIIKGAMHLQSQNAIGQAGLLIGRDNITRVDPSKDSLPKNGIELDDTKKSIQFLPNAADKAFLNVGDKIKNTFFQEKATPYKPLYQDHNHK